MYNPMLMMDAKLRLIFKEMWEKVEASEELHEDIEKLFYLIHKNSSEYDQAYPTNDRVALDFIEQRMGTEDLTFLTFKVLEPEMKSLQKNIEEMKAREKREDRPDYFEPYVACWDLESSIRQWKTVLDAIALLHDYCCKELWERGALEDTTLSEETKDKTLPPIKGPRTNQYVRWVFDYCPWSDPLYPFKEASMRFDRVTRGIDGLDAAIADDNAYFVLR